MGTRVSRERCIHFQLLNIHGDEERSDCKKMGGTSSGLTHCQLWTHSKLSTATQRQRIYSKQRGMGPVKVMYPLSPALYRKQHITASSWENSTLHKVTAFWGQHSHSLGVKLTPQLDQENVCKCVWAHWRTHRHARASVCVHTAVFLQFPYSFS